MGQRNQPILDEEVTFAQEKLVSRTDLRGVITYANDAFCRIAGYSREELLGHNHNLVRHPDMPKAAFEDLWSKLKSGRHWRGAVKNRCKDGRYYWVDAFITPEYEGKQLVGYQSVRIRLEPEYRQRAEKMYARLNRNQRVEQWYHHVIFRHLLFAVLAICIIAGAHFYPLLSCILVVLPFLIYQNELITVPSYFKKLRKRFDSPSRWIYSGRSEQSICDFHIHIYQGRIRTIVGRVLDSAEPIHQTSTQLARSAEQAKMGSSQQSDQLHQISVAMEQMVQTIDDITKNIQHTASEVDEAQQSCQHANEVMGTTSTQISALAADITRSSKSAQDLNQEAEKIESIMQEIQGISEQTNLLALNAAIEAARAGDQGRGFAVVADEVRALSQRSYRATEQIQDSISGIQSTLRSWVAIMAASQKAAEACVSETQQTQDAVSLVVSSVSGISALTTQISAAVEQQNVVSREINRNVSEVHQLSDDNLKQAEFVALFAENIEARVEQLKALALTFGN
ncbi:methyl-accepting chemotaxis protein [Celerinatantimonas sp. YJH-8]|uniref:methyl-accepting chemotaxis protein n=1 Tax=Celerinatantimonas sp. YJH-8 TaxID=3228714 RepID=UPI0038C0F99C